MPRDDRWALAEKVSLRERQVREAAILSVLSAAYGYEHADYAAVKRAVDTAMEKVHEV